MWWGLSAAPIPVIAHRESPTSPRLSAPEWAERNYAGGAALAMLALEPLGEALALLRHMAQQFLDVGSLGSGREVAQSPRLLAQYLWFGHGV